MAIHLVGEDDPPKPEPPKADGSCKTCESDEDKKKKEEKKKKAEKMTEKMSDKAKAAVAKSPKLQGELADLSDKGYKIRVDDAHPDVGYVDRGAKEIVLGTNRQDDFSLSHEVGHALYGESGGFQPPDPSGLSRADYVNQGVAASLKDEGAATFNQYAVRADTLANGGPDIGNMDPKAAAIYGQYQSGALTQDQATTQMGDLYRGYNTSTTGQNYVDYYSGGYNSGWSQAHPIKTFFGW